jgi:hypothetical protein
MAMLIKSGSRIEVIPSTKFLWGLVIDLLLVCKQSTNHKGYSNNTD